ncbi:FixH family protein [Mesobacterium pallidum]|uniref:FixH family protein n=1 Tax=Mesobacterium pallidum TaxID=2872037 RepID=UPI001EE2147A|nr:FixH family protein [Mesobacterium pallidum]
MADMQEPKIKGWHVFAGFAAAFGVIITVNVVMATKAIGTFPGLEVKNSYVASQTFDARREAQLALGWTARAETDGKTLRLSMRDAAGQPLQPAALAAQLGRPTEVKDDSYPSFTFDGSDYVAPVDLGPGYWHLRVNARAADGTAFEQRLDLYIAG